MTGNSLAKPSTASPMNSLRAQSLSTIQTAIHSPHDAGSCLKRVNAVLSMPGYYARVDDPETSAAIRKDFCMALAEFPDWAIQRAFDTWIKTMTRTPSPGEIVILVHREMKPLFDEVSARQRLHAPRQAERKPVDAAEAERIMHSNGFTAKRMQDIRKAPMSITFADAEGAEAEKRKPHWTETADPDGPEMAQLRASRAANPLVQAALASQAAKNQKAGAA